MTAMARGCNICEPAPRANARGNIPQTVAMAVIRMGRLRRSAACSIAWRASIPLARNCSSASSNRMPFLATIPITMMSPMKLATLKFVPVISNANTTPASESTELVRMEIGRSKIAKLGQQHAENQGERQHQNAGQIGK